MRRFCVTARICRPKVVQRVTTSSTAKTASVKTMIQSRL